MMKMLFISRQKLFSFSRRLDKKDKVNFNFFFEVTAWLTSNCNTHIAQYLEKQRQSDNEIWSVYRM